ncbi:MAG: phosphate ABC transporter permease subunit PstC [Marinilabiliaceae bacterium]|nr:phosphate ABC transporter permease subunit PstC [Marinilabiliaceae bacterium]
MLISLTAILLIPLFIIAGLYLKSTPLFNHQDFLRLISSSEWQPHKGNFGFWPFIAGSLYVTIIAFALAAPVCLLAAIYLTQFARSAMMRIMLPVIDILAGLPSVIYGVWGILIVVPFISKILAPAFNINTSGYTIFAGGVVLAVMCIPYMLNMIIEVFNTIPMGLKEASLSLGATFWESIKHVVIRKSYPGIISAFGLGIAKAFGETMAVMMVVGNSVQVKFNPFEAGYPLPALIANNYGEMLSIPLYDSALMFGAFLLLIIILLINLIFRYFIYRTRVH